MFVFRFTQILLNDMKVSPEENEFISPLFSWHANIIKLNNRKHIILINDLSRLSVIIDGIRSSQFHKLVDKFRITLTEYLKTEGMEQKLIDLYIRDGQEIAISKTNNRSVLGTMKEVTLYSTDVNDFENEYELMKWINRIIHKPIDYKEPIKVFKDAIQSNYL
ncbi:hypothetical protein GXP70_07965 [Paenibacillus lycopersici]|uniref:DUF6933 domain-containing protein n=1 Tax=Paenibacillus lycopersici TaxID=2704462 RepID=A0A6C0G7R6_9BACL|nr:hypothetical protein [Paenibacillus lycopersici]QHT63801.1 hypothetical protein GXP70_07965 [Paenibacillus lycopersici]